MKYLIYFFLFCAAAPLLLLGKEEKVAILGDSIAYDGKWPALIEYAMRQSPKYKDAQIVNFGLPSETTSGLSENGHAGGAFPRPCVHSRLARVLAQYKPDLVIACYGINDGIYQALDKARFKAYQNGMTLLKADVEKAGGKILFITPPPHQADRPEQSEYDKVMDAYSKWLVGQRKKGWMVVDMRPALKKAIAGMKKKDPAFTYAGDGVHPGPAGHRMIAEAIWPQLAKILNATNSVTFPDGDDFAGILAEHQKNKTDWLVKTGHSRPQIPGYRPEGQAEPPEGHASSTWNGFTKHDFKVDGRNAFVVLPDKAAKGNPWIWRTEFFGHEPQGDIALLKHGFAAVYVDVQNMYGSPESMKIMDAFYKYVTRVYGFSDKVVLEGFSRGGLFAFNWANLRPDRVAALYVDNPVCDFKSWPGGRGKGAGSPGDWNNLLKAYGFKDEQEALKYKKNPVDNLAAMAKAKIPVLAVIKVDDTVVPVAENIDLVEKRYKKSGGPITVIRDPGDHHPHSLRDPAPIVDFILKATGQEVK